MVMEWLIKYFNEILVAIIAALAVAFILWLIAKLIWPKTTTYLLMRKLKRQANNNKGINFNGRYYAWGVPALKDLKDEGFIMTPEGLTGVLKKDMNLEVANRLADKKIIEESKGGMQVFQIESGIKREVRGYIDQVLFVKPRKQP
jgi:hypothetical protein